MDESLNRSLSREEAKKNFKNARQRVDVASSNRTKRKAKDNATFGRNVLGAVTNTLGVDLADSAAVTETSSARPPRYSEQAESKQYPKGKSKAVNAKSKTQTAKCDKNGATKRKGSQNKGTKSSEAAKRRKRTQALGSEEEEEELIDEQPSSPEPELQFSGAGNLSKLNHGVRSSNSMGSTQELKTPACLQETVDESKIPAQMMELREYALSLKRKLVKMEEAGCEKYNKAEEERRRSMQQTIELTNSVRSTSDMQLEICKLQKRLKECKAKGNSEESSELASMRKQLDGAKRKLFETMQNNDSLSSTKKELEEIVEQKNAEISKLEEKLESRQKQVDELQQREANLIRQCDDAFAQRDEANETARQCQNETEIFKQQFEEVEQERLRLREELLDLKGNIRVLCRVRPALSNENGGKTRLFEFPKATHDGTTKIEMLDHSRTKNVAGESVKPKAWPFTFNRIFTPQNGQEDVFSEVCPVVESCLNGYRACIFAYGQTGAGKTYTMLGNTQEIQSKKDDNPGNSFGIIPRSVNHLFHKMKQMEDHGWKSSISAQILEIYNEQVYDLLGNQGKTNLDVKVDKGGEVSIPGLTQYEVSTLSEIWELIRIAAKCRATSSTTSNEESSRSHSVFTLKVNLTHSTSGESRDGLLHLIDLAGSERVSKSGTSGTSLKEAQNINKSLSTLGKVVSSLANKSKHVPFRDSKLTRLLQPSLSNEQNSKALMICNLSPLEEHAQESLCTLRFAHSVAQCTLKA